MKTGGSGLYLNANDKDAFEHFLLNSIGRFYRSGGTGMTYILTLKPRVQSKYLSLDASTYGKQVRNLLLHLFSFKPLKI